MSVDLIRSGGDDLAVVNAARVSLHKESTWEVYCPKCGKIYDDEPVGCHCDTDGYDHRLREADVGLINYLAKNRHGTPFEMVEFWFRVRCPIGVAREWQRHRIGSFNEVSTRYVNVPNEAYLPPIADMRTQVGKPGHYRFEPLPADKAAALRDYMEVAYKTAFEFYESLLADGLAREVARNVLPLGTMTEFVWKVNLRSLFNFCYLRNADTALREIQHEAKTVEALAERVAPVAVQAWRANGRLPI